MDCLCAFGLTHAATNTRQTSTQLFTVFFHSVFFTMHLKAQGSKVLRLRLQFLSTDSQFWFSNSSRRVLFTILPFVAVPLRRCSVCGGYVGCDCQDLSKIPDLFFKKMSDLIPAPVAKGDMPQVGLLKKKKKKDKRLKSKPKEPGSEEEGENTLPAGQPDRQPDDDGDEDMTGTQGEFLNKAMGIVPNVMGGVVTPKEEIDETRETKRPRARSLSPTQAMQAVAIAVGNGILQNTVASHIVATDTSASATAMEVMMMNDTISGLHIMLATQFDAQTTLMSTMKVDMDGIKTDMATTKTKVQDCFTKQVDLRN